MSGSRVKALRREYAEAHGTRYGWRRKEAKRAWVTRKQALTGGREQA